MENTQKKCCNQNCNQGRTCPNRVEMEKTSNIDIYVFVVSLLVALVGVYQIFS